LVVAKIHGFSDIAITKFNLKTHFTFCFFSENIMYYLHLKWTELVM